MQNVASSATNFMSIEAEPDAELALKREQDRSSPP
jgi:hypothetical protein